MSITKLIQSYPKTQEGNRLLQQDLLLLHKWYTKKTADPTRFFHLTRTQMREHAIALADEIKARGMKLPEYKDDLTKVWSEEARAAALEARRMKAKRLKGLSFESSYRVDPKNVKRIEGYFRELPDKDLKGIKKVQVKQHLGEFTWNEHTESISGTYNRKEGVIQIHQWSPPEVVYHEVGHNVYHNLSWEPSMEWTKTWSDNKEVMPTDYAKFNESEGFAECYMKYQADELPEGITAWFDKNVGKKKK